MCLKKRKTVYLISCAKKQLNTKTKVIAAALYISPLFRLMLQYALLCVKGDIRRIYILSSEHELLKLTDEVNTYDTRLECLSKEAQENWGENIVRSLTDEGYDLGKDRFVILAGKTYVDNIIQQNKIKELQLPLEGKKLGEQMRYLKEEIEKLRLKAASQL